MNSAPLLRPLRSMLQGRLQLATTTRTARTALRPATRLRTNASIATDPKAAAAAVDASAPSTATTTSPPPPTPLSNTTPLDVQEAADAGDVSRMPRSLEALYLKPLRREAEFGVPSCDLQLRSYSVRNLEFFCDFALRAAYYCGLPAFGPVPLPRKTERWTVPKGHFIDKKSQENFERITLRRLIQIRDGHPETVQVWLAFLQKHAYYGIGMKANVWEFSKLGVGKAMDEKAAEVSKLLEDKWEHLGHVKKLEGIEDIEEFLATERTKVSGGRIARAGARQQLLGSFFGPAELRCTGSPRSLSHTRTLTLTLAQRRRFASSRSGPLPVGPTAPTAPKVIFSGIQPTGVPHLGNYLGALKQWKRMQDEADPGTTLLFSIVDLHALTMPRRMGTLAQGKREMLAALLAVGLDPQRSIIFYQSTVPAHSELQWILSCTASMGYLSRMTQWKDKMALATNASLQDDGTTKRLKHGLFSYPILQAADILVHRATHVPVGDDQRQHLEFARECVTNFNHAYGGSYLVAPQTMVSPAKRVMSLRDPTKKMSKSDLDPFSTITLADEAYKVQKKITTALTDSDPTVSYDPAGRPGVANLLELWSHFDPHKRTPAVLAAGLVGVQNHLGTLKARVGQAVEAEMQEIRERYLEFLAPGKAGYLDEVVQEGGRKARESAEETMKIVREAVELGA
ncbi:putative tryptophanyl-tRNA synthetase [Podospora appendiculata]|uniref:Small ribosomal subunit protein uS10m n=1 Tax=Podospora appendiculata TaxID=314037 RepID=A0AAE1CFV9_9PEZI|nr:putative tryptophanyl-tRNA synthetase [Podospora appendiculata]